MFKEFPVRVEDQEEGRKEEVEESGRELTKG